MISLEFLAIAAPVFMAVVAVSAMVVTLWLEERAERRRHPAE